MGNNTSRIGGCFAPFSTCGDTVNLEFLEPLDEGLGHSFCYVRPVIADSPAITPSNSERYTACSSTVDSETNSGSFRQEVVVEDLSNIHRHNTSLPETTFKTISGASVSANASTARTGGNLDLLLSGEVQQPAASFESTASFAAIPLQPMPRGLGPVDGFMSGPLERVFASGPLERGAGFMSGPLDGIDRSNFSAPLAYGQRNTGIKVLVSRMSRPVRNAFSWTLTKRWHSSGWMKKLLLQPMTQLVWHPKEMKSRQDSSKNFPDVGTSETEYSNMKNLQWAHGKAGEDRVHVVLSEEQGWLFVGIYDGFSGPDAPDFLMSNLYKAIDKELEGLLWDYGDNSQECRPSDARPDCNSHFSCSNVGGEESMLPKVHSVVSQVQFSNTQSCNDYSENRCSNEFSLSLDKKVDECVMNPELSNVLEIGGDVVEDKVRSKNVDNKEISCEIYREQILNVLEKNTHSVCDANIVQGKVSTCALVENSVGHYRRSKCLYELLQMELVEDSKSKDFGLASDVRFGSSGILSNNLFLVPRTLMLEVHVVWKRLVAYRKLRVLMGRNP
ncbi:hypothetical protein HPP92_002306 [Vanilla planifolia]|uniref:protein-serine/threonine phosphatase n=1 Tax=Vanilla planifolia TaxID=51239 RepID=A0A835S1D0_VANPL|nr:hypothetical protein HPP92_002306 [Vanilla planifolia]